VLLNKEYYTLSETAVKQFIFIYFFTFYIHYL